MLSSAIEFARCVEGIISETEYEQQAGRKKCVVLLPLCRSPPLICFLTTVSTGAILPGFHGGGFAVFCSRVAYNHSPLVICEKTVFTQGAGISVGKRDNLENQTSLFTSLVTIAKLVSLSELSFLPHCRQTAPNLPDMVILRLK